MKTKTMLLSLLSLLALSACQPEFEVSLCEGRPAFDLSPLAGTYRLSRYVEIKDGKTRVSGGEDGEMKPLELTAKEGKLVSADGVVLSACRVEPYLWVETSEPGFKGGVLLDGGNSLYIRLGAYSEKLLSQNKVPFEKKESLGLSWLAIRNKGVSARKVLESLDPDHGVVLLLAK